MLFHLFILVLQDIIEKKCKSLFNQNHQKFTVV